MAKNKLKKRVPPSWQAEDQNVPEIAMPQLTPEQEELNKLRVEVTTAAARKLLAEIDKDAPSTTLLNELGKLTGHGYF